MILTRNETAQLFQVAERYLCPSNFEHIKAGAKEKGYNLIKMEGRGKNALYTIEEIQTNLKDEIWKPYPDNPQYLVSNFGRIKNPKGFLMSGYNSKGYIRTRIGECGQLPNHRIVMLTFNPIENAHLYVVDHINGIKTDNRLSNLRWVFQSENAQFSDKNNTELKEILANLIQKYGYDETKSKLLTILNEN